MNPKWLYDIDTYKLDQAFYYPKNIKKTSFYLSFRKPFLKEDHRIVWIGLSEILSQICETINSNDIQHFENLLTTMNNGKKFNFPKDLFTAMLSENSGHLPLTITALPDGTVVYPHTPVLQVCAEEKYAPLAYWIENILIRSWVSTQVATFCMQAKNELLKAFEISVDTENYKNINRKIHYIDSKCDPSLDFSLIAGRTHLIFFTGSDNLYAASSVMNKSDLAVYSSPEISQNCINSWPNQESLNHFLATFDLNTNSSIRLQNNPQSISNYFDTLNRRDLKINSLNFTVLKNKIFIDGISNIDEIKYYIDFFIQKKISADSICYGINGKNMMQDRNTLSAAFKISHIEYQNNQIKDIATFRKETYKNCLPGIFAVDKLGFVFPKENCKQDEFQLVYKNGVIFYKNESIRDIQDRINSELKIKPPLLNNISPELNTKIESIRV